MEFLELQDPKELIRTQATIDTKAVLTFTTAFFNFCDGLDCPKFSVDASLYVFRNICLCFALLRL